MVSVEECLAERKRRERMSGYRTTRGNFRASNSSTFTSSKKPATTSSAPLHPRFATLSWSLSKSTKTCPSTFTNFLPSSSLSDYDSARSLATRRSFPHLFTPPSTMRYTTSIASKPSKSWDPSSHRLFFRLFPHSASSKS